MTEDVAPRASRAAPGAAVALLRATALLELAEPGRGFLADSVRELLEACSGQAEPRPPTPEEAWQALTEDLARLVAFCRAQETAGAWEGRPQGFRKLQILLEDVRGLALAEGARAETGRPPRQVVAGPG